MYWNEKTDGRKGRLEWMEGTNGWIEGLKEKRMG